MIVADDDRDWHGRLRAGGAQREHGKTKRQ